MDVAKNTLDLVAVREDFDGNPKRVFLPTELETFFRGQSRRWKWRGSFDGWLRFMFEHTALHQLRLPTAAGGSAWRYTWGPPRLFELVASFTGNVGYLSHSSALAIWGLVDSVPKVLVVNVEQTPKPRPDGKLTQSAVDNAFRRPQRVSKRMYSLEPDHRIIVANGKHTGRLGVVTTVAPDDVTVPVTSLNRTLIDIVVRPDYAGGPAAVLDAFRRAKESVDTEALVGMLEALKYKYPYHQALGFYLKAAGYSGEGLSLLRVLPRRINFYVGHAIGDRAYDEDWRVYYPATLGQ